MPQGILTEFSSVENMWPCVVACLSCRKVELFFELRFLASVNSEILKPPQKCEFLETYSRARILDFTNLMTQNSRFFLDISVKKIRQFTDILKKLVPLSHICSMRTGIRPYFENLTLCVHRQNTRKSWPEIGYHQSSFSNCSI